MKALVTLLMILLVSVQVDGQVFGKKKSKNVDPRDAQIDSLTTLSKTLALQVDSLTVALGAVTLVPDSVKAAGDTTTVIPAALPVQQASSDSIPVKAQSDLAPVPLIVEPRGPAGPDSLCILSQENKMLRATIDSLKTDWDKKMEIMTSEEVVKSTAINDLKRLKELLDANIITAAEFALLKKKYIEKL